MSAYRIYPTGHPVTSRPVAHSGSARPALSGVSFSLEPGQSLGLVGRTGSGKSSLLAALFRMHPICGGAVFIDDVNIANVSVETLRYVARRDMYRLTGHGESNIGWFGVAAQFSEPRFFFFFVLPKKVAVLHYLVIRISSCHYLLYAYVVI